MGNSNYTASTLAVIKSLTDRAVDYVVDGLGNVFTHTYANGREVWTEVLHAAE